MTHSNRTRLTARAPSGADHHLEVWFALANFVDLEGHNTNRLLRVSGPAFALDRRIQPGSSDRFAPLQESGELVWRDPGLAQNRP